MEEENRGMMKMAANLKKFSSLDINMQEAEVKEQKQDVYTIDKPVEEALGDDMYPCVLAMMGSGFGFMTVSLYLSFICFMLDIMRLTCMYECISLSLHLLQTHRYSFWHPS